MTLAICLGLVIGCASPRGAAPGLNAVAVSPGMSAQSESSVSTSRDAVETVLAGARATLGRNSPRLDGEAVPTDCSGYLHALYKRAGVDLFSESRPGDNGVRAIYRFIERRGRFHRGQEAAPGDLVFFDNSYDRNGDGRLNDRLTHAGLVEQVLADGTMLIVHATNHGIVREPMNLFRPHDTASALNAPLRRKTAGDGPRTPHLMSELFAGLGSVFDPGPLRSRRSDGGREAGDSQSPRPGGESAR